MNVLHVSAMNTLPSARHLAVNQQHSIVLDDNSLQGFFCLQCWMHYAMRQCLMNQSESRVIFKNTNISVMFTNLFSASQGSAYLFFASVVATTDVSYIFNISRALDWCRSFFLPCNRPPWNTVYSSTAPLKMGGCAWVYEHPQSRFCAYMAIWRAPHEKG